MKAKNLITIFIMVVIAWGLTSCGLLSKHYEKKEKEEYKLNVTGKKKLELNNISGHINISQGDSATGLVIETEKVGHVRKKDLDIPLEIKINLDTNSDVIKISTEMQKKKEWIHFDLYSNAVNFDIKVPPGIELSIKNVNGEMKISDISNESNVSLTNGNLKINNISGKQEFDLTNGKVSGFVDSLKSLKVDVLNGSVNLDIGKNFKGEVNAESVNGKISYENLQLSDVSQDRKSLRGYIINHENEINIKTVNGKILLGGENNNKPGNEKSKENESSNDND